MIDNSKYIEVPGLTVSEAARFIHSDVQRVGAGEHGGVEHEGGTLRDGKRLTYT